MKNFSPSALSLVVALAFVATGCSEESKVTEKTKVSTPEGATTVSKETKVESTGKNPPAVVPTKP